jgi:sigma-B regulation protein RsbU (phosphoserine phosphatase)
MPRYHLVYMDAKAVVLTADEVLHVFHRSEIFLLLGAAFATVGIVSAAISFFGRKFDPLLFWLAIFAFVYGNRLWLQTPLMAFMVPDAGFFRALRASANYLVPIPAFFYFDAAGYLGRLGRILLYPLTGIMGCLVICVFIFGPLHIFDTVNTVTSFASDCWSSLPSHCGTTWPAYTEQSSLSPLAS